MATLESVMTAVRGKVPAGLLWRVAALLGIAIAAYTQSLLTDQVVIRTAQTFGPPGWEFIIRGTLRYAAAIAFGAVLFAIGCSRLIGTPSLRSYAMPSGPGLRIDAKVLAATLLLLTVGWGWLMWQLWIGRYSLGFVAGWVGVLALWTLMCSAADVRDGRLPRLRIGAVDLATIACAWVYFLAVNATNLDNWYFSAMGDEFGTYHMARLVPLGAGSTLNLFSQHGLYDVHPMWMTYAPGLVMSVLGTDRFGWKMAEVVQVLATLVPFYFLARTIGGTRVAILATAFATVAQHMMAFVHTGHGNLDALLPTMAAFGFALAAERHRSFLYAGLAGTFAGLAYYTFFTSRLAIVVLAVYALTRWRVWFRAGLALPLAIGFLLAVGPMFAVNKEYVILAMLKESSAGQGRSIAQLLQDVGGNLYRNVVAYHYNAIPGRYLHGGLFDPITAVLATLGIALAIATWRAPARRFLLIWYAIGMVVLAGLAQPGRFAETRLHLVSLALAIAAGIALDAILRIVQTWSFPRLIPIINVAVCAAVIPAAAYANNHRFLVESPPKLLSLPEGLTERALQTTHCGETRTGTSVIVSQNLGMMGFALDADNHAGQYPIMVQPTDRASLPSYTGAPCFIFIHMSPDEARGLAAYVRERLPIGDLRTEQDLSGRMSIYVADNLSPRPEAPPRWDAPSALRVSRRYGSPGISPGQLNQPRGLAIGAGGELYVADMGNNRVMKFAADGALDAGWAANGVARLATPTQVAVGADGVAYVLETAPPSIVRLGRTGAVEWRRAIADRPPPVAMAVGSDGSLLLVETGGGLARMSPDGTVAALAIDWGAPFAPGGLAVAGDGHVFVSDGGRNQIAVLSPDLVVARRWAASGASLANARLGAVDDVGVAVLVPNERTIAVFDRDGRPVGRFAGRAIQADNLELPTGFTADPSGYVYVADAVRGWVLKLAPLS